MTSTLILSAAPLLLAAVLAAEYRAHTPGKILAKGLLSSLFVWLACLPPAGDPIYAWAVRGGLLLCLVGDVCLAIPGRSAFRVGLAAFLAGHVGYVTAFARVGHPGVWMWLVGLGGLALSSLVYRLLLPYLKEMRTPVLCYVVVITCMLITAGAVYGQHQLPLDGRRLVLGGAAAFYLSDLFVARQRFVRETFVNRLIGLPLYYAGQFAIAATAGIL